jgi:integrase
LAGEAGLRRAEVAVVHTDDLIEDITGWSLVVHGKGGKQRVVPLTDRLANAIHDFRLHGYLFPGQIDGHISAHHVGVLISRLMPDGWSMHKLRHRAATRGYAGTGNLRAVQEFLGHASVATTERYTAVSSRDVRGVSEAAGVRSIDQKKAISAASAWAAIVAKGVDSVTPAHDGPDVA